MVGSLNNHFVCDYYYVFILIVLLPLSLSLSLPLYAVSYTHLTLPTNREV